MYRLNEHIHNLIVNNESFNIKDVTNPDTADLLKDIKELKDLIDSVKVHVNNYEFYNNDKVKFSSLKPMLDNFLDDSENQKVSIDIHEVLAYTYIMLLKVALVSYSVKYQQGSQKLEDLIKWKL